MHAVVHDICLSFVFVGDLLVLFLLCVRSVSLLCLSVWLHIYVCLLVDVSVFVHSSFSSICSIERYIVSSSLLAAALTASSFWAQESEDPRLPLLLLLTSSFVAIRCKMHNTFLYYFSLVACSTGGSSKAPLASLPVKSQTLSLKRPIHLAARMQAQRLQTQHIKFFCRSCA